MLLQPQMYMVISNKKFKKKKNRTPKKEINSKKRKIFKRQLAKPSKVHVPQAQEREIQHPGHQQLSLKSCPPSHAGISTNTLVIKYLQNTLCIMTCQTKKQPTRIQQTKMLQTKKQPAKISDQEANNQEEPEQEEQPGYTKQDTPTKIHTAEDHTHLRHKSVKYNTLATNSLA